MSLIINEVHTCVLFTTSLLIIQKKKIEMAFPPTQFISFVAIQQSLNVSAHVADNLFFISNPDNANSLENSVMSLFPRNLVNNTKKLWHSPQLTEF